MGFLGIKSAGEKTQEREIQFRRARKALQNYISKCGDLKRQYFENGRRAAALGDEPLRHQFAAGYVQLHDQVQRAEKMLLFLDGVRLRQEAVRANGTFLEFARAVSTDLLTSPGTAEVKDIQTRMAAAVEKADVLDASLGETIDSLSAKVIASPVVDEQALAETEKLFEGEPATAAFTKRVQDVERSMTGAR